MIIFMELAGVGSVYGAQRILMQDNIFLCFPYSPWTIDSTKNSDKL